MQPKSSRKFAGLTRTLEEDLKSDDAYLRERAQRLLRLQKQILQLRSRQPAAETAPPMATNNTEDNSIPINRGDTAAATEALGPSLDLTPSSNNGTGEPNDAEQRHSDTNTSTQHSNDINALTSDHQILPQKEIADQHVSEEATTPPTETSANASLLESVVVDGPIDRLGLANNLFAVGEYSLALEMYHQIKGSDFSSQQQFWVEYQIACCLRHLGNPAEASNRFRKLASQPEAGWLSQQAHRWVEHLEKMRILEKAMKENSVKYYQEVIENVEAAIVELPTETKAASTVSESSKSLEPAKDEQTH